MKKSISFIREIPNTYDTTYNPRNETHHPQKEFEKPFTALNCFAVIADTPPKIVEYGNLKRERVRQNKYLKRRLIKISVHICYEKLNRIIDSLETERIYRNRHVPRLVRTRIQIPVVERYQINIMKDKAVELVGF